MCAAGPFCVLWCCFGHCDAPALRGAVPLPGALSRFGRDTEVRRWAFRRLFHVKQMLRLDRARGDLVTHISPSLFLIRSNDRTSYCVSVRVAVGSSRRARRGCASCARAAVHTRDRTRQTTAKIRIVSHAAPHGRARVVRSAADRLAASPIGKIAANRSSSHSALCLAAAITPCRRGRANRRAPAAPAPS